MSADNEWLKREVNTNEEDYTRVAKNFYSKGKIDTVREMQEMIADRCVKGGIYPAFVKSTIDQIAKELLDER